jgi:hypothetical protein
MNMKGGVDFQFLKRRIVIPLEIRAVEVALPREEGGAVKLVRQKCGKPPYQCQLFLHPILSNPSHFHVESLSHLATSWHTSFIPSLPNHFQ